GLAFTNFVTTDPYDDGYSALQKPAASCVSNKLAGGRWHAFKAKFNSSRAACTIVICSPSASMFQNLTRSPQRYGSITARLLAVATWIRHSSGRNVSSETNSVSMP